MTLQAFPARLSDADKGWLPADHGLLACSVGDPNTASQTFQPATGVPVYSRVKAATDLTVANVKLVVSQAGTGATALANCFVGVFNSAGTRIGVSANQNTNWATANEKTIAITVDAGQSLAVVGGIGRWIWVALLVGTQSTTPVQFRSVASSSAITNFGLSASSPFRCGTLGSGLSALPTSITASSMTTAAGPLLVGIT